MFNYDHTWGFMGGGMWLLWLIFIIVIFLLIKNFNTSSNSASEQNETALDILKKRYAKGEITKEEFEEQKKTLHS
ncbi:MAG: SHOCT domain-containing protein [Hydrogenovibrio crunogenus]|jgi:putative membrane protein|uniref:Electron transporter RnfE n=3 Tax=Hydrogenovibrio TaxID=28884 RepID=A0A4P7P292_9GAMM|nr:MULTISPECIES: SHOCT domain-containing protein [Piscirickettsiaceae]RUM93084.1 MAG: SHOCT domain-containing protein [Thiomicrospira sp.]AZR81099.1 electron transporter RnfE [Thiomicrospira sp. S5]MBD3612189.1 SHOCT domain-containing protein [Hydrogenovibrio crunogenus]QAB16253.1 SHOCT domain-containing protein [Hydrogenovibrio thermophilus]QBZ84146.1 electron transporter RnfE [Hydrogenovibrio crunogenus]